MVIWASQLHRAMLLRWDCSRTTRMSEEGEPKGLGRFEGKVHVLPISVYYEDTDLSGVVYHANYLRYMERGRTEFFRLAGISKMAGLENDEPTSWAIRNIQVEYLRP